MLTASQRSLRGRLPAATGMVVLGLALMVSLFFMAMALAEPILTVHTPVFAADVIVVPGGDGPLRAARAAALYHTRAAPRVLVTGSGDCLGIRDLMVAANVPGAEITVECAARDTWENATRSAPLLNGMNARSAILVTNWFHSRRALGCFRVRGTGDCVDVGASRARQVAIGARDPPGRSQSRQRVCEDRLVCNSIRAGCGLAGSGAHRWGG